MKRFALCASVCLIALFAIACDDRSSEIVIDEVGMGLTVSQNDSNVFAGAYRNEKTIVRFETEAVDGAYVIIEATIDGHRLDYEVDVERMALSIEGHGALLTKDQKTALAETVQSIGKHINREVSPEEYHLFGLLQALGYWSRAPEGYVHNTLIIGSLDNAVSQGVGVVRSPSMGNEGITCIRKGTYVNAEYDDRYGAHSNRIMVGSTARPGWECMGRCGGGCGSWWKASSWTKDCMDHDQCGAANNSSGGTFDSNCGDEFDEAADDWAWGVMKGCRG